MKKIIAVAFFALIIGAFLFYYCTPKFEIDQENGIISVKQMIMPDDSIDSLNRGKTIFIKAEFYLVSGYKSGKAIDKKIEEFTCKAVDPDFEKYYQYDIHFYKKSHRLNDRKIKGEYRLFYEYANDRDFICSFTWFSGKLTGKRVNDRYKDYNSESKPLDCD